MSREEIFEKLKYILKYTLSNADEILPIVSEGSDLFLDLGLTSVGMLYIVISVEEMFKISMSNARFDDFKTVKDVIDYLEKKINL